MRPLDPLEQQDLLGAASADRRPDRSHAQHHGEPACSATGLTADCLRVTELPLFFALEETPDRERELMDTPGKTAVLPRGSVASRLLGW